VASIQDWMVQWSSGTWMIVPKDNVVNTNKREIKIV